MTVASLKPGRESCPFALPYPRPGARCTGAQPHLRNLHQCALHRATSSYTDYRPWHHYGAW